MLKLIKKFDLTHSYGISKTALKKCPEYLIVHQNAAKLTGTPTARGLFVAFLPSRPLWWGFRMFFRSNFPTFRPCSPRTEKFGAPLHRFRVGLIT
jgi:hypothetical protein